jgi:hypothetical protein
MKLRSQVGKPAPPVPVVQKVEMPVVKSIEVPTATVEDDPFALPEEKPQVTTPTSVPLASTLPVVTEVPPTTASTSRSQLPIDTNQEMAKIIESVFQVDLDSTWRRIHEALLPGKGGASAAKAIAVIDDRCREAHKVYCALKLEYERYKSDCEATMAAMRCEASELLQAEKETGERKKTVTEADVRAKMIELHPDEVRNQEVKLRKFALAVEHAEHMVKVMSQRSRSLNTEVGRGLGGTAED